MRGKHIVAKVVKPERTVSEKHIAGSPLNGVVRERRMLIFKEIGTGVGLKEASDD
jgi:hypothetical protein